MQQSDFNKITDLRHYLLAHPDGEMVLLSCLHFLGDDAQKWWIERIKSNISKRNLLDDINVLDCNHDWQKKYYNDGDYALKCSKCPAIK